MKENLTTYNFYSWKSVLKVTQIYIFLISNDRCIRENRQQCYWWTYILKDKNNMHDQ